MWDVLLLSCNDQVGYIQTLLVNPQANPQGALTVQWCNALRLLPGRGGGRGPKGGAGDPGVHVHKIIKMIKDKGLDPVIVFSFSRRSAPFPPTTSPCSCSGATELHV